MPDTHNRPRTSESGDPPLLPEARESGFPLDRRERTGPAVNCSYPPAGPAGDAACPPDENEDDPFALLARERAARIEAEQAHARLLDLLRHARQILWSRDVILVGGQDVWEPMIIDEDAAQTVLPLETDASTPFSVAWYRATPYEERERSREEFLPLLRAEETALEREFHCTDRYGKERWLLERVSIRPVGLNRWRLNGVATDISDRKRIEQALQDSETRFRDLADNIAQIAWMCHPDGKTFWFNRRWEEYTGLPRDASMGADARRHLVHHPDHQARVIAGFERALQSGEPWEDTFPLRGQDGCYRWFLSRAAPIRDETGRVVRWFGTNTDIDDRKRMEERLRVQADELTAINAELEARAADLMDTQARAERRAAELDAVIASIADGIGVYGPTGETIHLNEAGRRILGITDEWRTLSVMERSRRLRYFTADDVPVPVEDLAAMRALRGETVRGEWIQARRLDGVNVWLSVSAAPIRNADGTLIGAVAVFTDVTERKATEAALREANERLLDADRRKDEFVAMLAHELRNPLSPIRAAARILRKRSREDATLVRMSDIVDHQVTHMAGLIDGLLDASRIGQGRIDLDRRMIDIEDVVRHAVESCRSAMEERGHVLSVALPTDGLRLQADPVRLEQILANLLHNAAKFTPSGGRIALLVERDGGDMLLRIRDNGLGISPELQPRIFDLFTQGDRTLDRSLGGLGIGLSLVKGLVILHGGTVTVHSDGPGMGSEFVVRLPASAAEPDAPALRPIEPAPECAPLRILLVEDNAEASETLGMLLEMEGHDVRAVADGAAAIEAVERFSPRVVVTDIGLPDMNGYEVAKRLRKRFGAGEMTLIALTGYGGDENRNRAREAGFDEHLTKPIDFTDLRRLLAAVAPLE